MVSPLSHMYSGFELSFQSFYYLLYNEKGIHIISLNKHVPISLWDTLIFLPSDNFKVLFRCFTAGNDYWKILKTILYLS